MINILLCDDEEKTLDRIGNYIDSIRPQIKYPIEITEYTSAEQILKRLHSSDKMSDILITDIDMPNLSGMELARVIQDERLDVILIFMTAHQEYVFQSFEYAPFRYIRKEFMETELLPALQAACKKANASRDIILRIKTHDGIKMIRTGDILYYELENRKCIIYTVQNKRYETWKKISDLKNEIGKMDESFLQIYRGCIVNKRYIIKIKSEAIVLENDIEIPISKRKRQEISDTMMHYWSEII